MKENTHTARLGSFKGMVLESNSDDSITFEAINSLFNNENKVVELSKRGDIYFYKDLFTVKEEDLTDIKPIKPIIEIPEGDFWVTVGALDKVYKVVKLSNGGYQRIDEDEEAIFNSIKTAQLINDEGAWKIVPKPEPVTRAWNDEEFKSYILSGKWLQYTDKSNDTALCKPWRINDRSVQFADYIDGYRTYSFSKIASHFKDDKGNLFAKTV